jgi:hypothetical protein
MVAVPAAADGSTPSMDGEAGIAPRTDDPEVQEVLADGSAAGDVPDKHLFDTSSYMLGSVAVDVIFMESNGSEEPESEDWSSSQKSKALSEIRDGLGFWENQAPARLDLRVSSRTLETGVEPIEHRGYTGSVCDNQYRWMQDAVQQLGYTYTELDCDDGFSGSVYVAMYERNHDLRNAEGTDWGYTIFLVDSQNDDDGEFSDGLFAYASLSGPYVVMTWDNDGWGPDRMDRVAAHETGHTFGATDEYNGESETWGYLWAQDDDGSSCLMDDNDYCLSTGSQHQVGWRDGDDDGVPDPLDTRPDVDELGFDGPASPTSDPTLDFAGTSADDPYPAAEEFQDEGFGSISVNDVTDATWSTSEASGSTTTDDADPHAAPWDLTTSTLADGTHDVTVSAENEVGAADPDPVTTTVTVDTTPPIPTLHDPAPGRVYAAGYASAEDPREGAGDEPATVTGGVIYLNATATDALTGVEIVEFYLDGALVEQQTSPPYESREILGPLTTGAPGEHTATVVARDVVGNEGSASQPYVVPASPPASP